jgi:hypothetical protein
MKDPDEPDVLCEITLARFALKVNGEFRPIEEVIDYVNCLQDALTAASKAFEAEVIFAKPRISYRQETNRIVARIMGHTVRKEND